MNVVKVSLIWKLLKACNGQSFLDCNWFSDLQSISCNNKSCFQTLFWFFAPFALFLFFQKDPYQVAPWKTVQVYSFSTDTLSHTYQSTQAALQSLILCSFEVCHMQASLIYMKVSTFQASRSRLKRVRII